MKHDDRTSFSLSVTLLAPIAATAQTVYAEEDIVLGDFDSGSFVGWKLEGDAFTIIQDADQLQKLDVLNADGGVASSESRGDEPQGRIISNEFEVNRAFITFRIAGGGHETHTCINLIVDDKVVRSTTGTWSDTLLPAAWDVRTWQGRQAHLEVVDQTGRDWGHISVDRIRLTDAPEIAPRAVAPLYTEALRPRFHITARQWTTNRLNPGMREEGWINDLNGMIYFDGEWHVFVQRWAKTWLHFVSNDLIHWTELEPGFYEAWNGEGMQSGSTVVDYGNTSGLSENKREPLKTRFYNESEDFRRSGKEPEVKVYPKDTPSSA